MILSVLNQTLVTIPPHWTGLVEFGAMITIGVTLGPIL